MEIFEGNFSGSIFLGPNVHYRKLVTLKKIPTRRQSRFLSRIFFGRGS